MTDFIRKGLKFARAYWKWAAAGKPLRSEEYIYELFDKHCAPCPFFKKETETQGECKSCGCAIKRVPPDEDQVNKLAWPTERCPEGFWTEDIDPP